MHKIRLPLGLRIRPRLGSLQRSPDPLAVFKGPTSKGREGKKGEIERKRRGRGREGGEGEGSGPLEPPRVDISDISLLLGLQVNR